MAAKKSQLVSAINSFGSARASGDGTLIAFAANLIGELIDTLEFAPEETQITNNDIIIDGFATRNEYILCIASY
jgi:hypothetical protein